MAVGRIQSTMARKETFQAEWLHVDAAGRILGRLAVDIATVLMGKHKPTYTAHVDTGDFVVVTNAEKIRVTGRKAQTMHYDRYTYHSGGYKEISYAQVLAKHPDRIITEAVRRMLPKNALGRRMLKKLKVYRGDTHPHAAQMPKPISSGFGRST
jgi:large subunit ribosomal protein L13